MLGHTYRLVLMVMVLGIAACQTGGDAVAPEAAAPQDTVVPLATAGVAAETAQSSDTPLSPGVDPFVGYWLGTTAPRGEVLREATVIVEPEPDGAFAITWKNFSAAGDGAGLVLRERTLHFLPTGEPGVWRAEGSGDPLDQFSSWASLDDDTLVVDVVAIDATGRLERQAYRRTVAGDGMSLAYTRQRDGSSDLVIEGTLLRLSED